MTIARLAFDRLAPAYDALASGEAFTLQRRQTHAALARVDTVREGSEGSTVGLSLNESL